MIRHAFHTILTHMLGPTFLCPIDGRPYRTRATQRGTSSAGRYIWARHRRCVMGRDQQHCYPLGRVWQTVEME